MSDNAVPPETPVGKGPGKGRSRDPETWVHRAMLKYKKSDATLAYRPDRPFFELADPVVETKRTLLGYDRLYTFWQAIKNLTDVPGAVAEIGSFRGGSAYFIASAFKHVCGAEVPMHVFDTFEGHPGAAITEHDPHHEAGQFGKTSYEQVSEYLAPFELIEIHKGDVIQTLPGLPESAYRLVHIDTDLYQPTLVCLDYFVPRMSPGGVIVLDDYASRKCPGVPQALVEFMARAEGIHAWDMRTEQLMLIKR